MVRGKYLEARTGGGPGPGVESGKLRRDVMGVMQDGSWREGSTFSWLGRAHRTPGLL